MVSPFLDTAALCYLTTVGRVSGKPHTVEIWFARQQATLYFLSGGGDRSDWVRNLLAHPKVAIEVGAAGHSGVGRLISDPDEDRLARELVHNKYQPGYGSDLTAWRQSSLAIAVDLAGL